MASIAVWSLLAPRALPSLSCRCLSLTACMPVGAGGPRQFASKALPKEQTLFPAIATTPRALPYRALSRRWGLSCSSRSSSGSSSSSSGGGGGGRKGPDDNKSRGDHLSPNKHAVENLKSLRSKILVPITPHEHIYNVPNALTFGRLLASPAIGYLILHDAHAAALALFALAGVTDLADGWIARRWQLQTVVGSVIDPMADKTLMTILTVCLAAKGQLPVWTAAIILGRDVALAVSAIYFRWISLPPPKTMARYWDFSLPSAEVHPTAISKLNTALQLALIGATMAHPLVAADWATALQAMQYTVATTTVLSGLSYVFSKDAVKILKHPSPRPGTPTTSTTTTEKDDATKL